MPGLGAGVGKVEEQQGGALNHQCTYRMCPVQTTVPTPPACVSPAGCVSGSGFGVEFRVGGLGFRIRGFGLRVEGFRCRVLGVGG